jgi:predicted MPP superfamily phosphohydrolase
MQRVSLVRIILPLLFFVIFSYVCHQLFRFSGLEIPWVIFFVSFLSLPFAAVLSMPLYFWDKENLEETRWFEWLQCFAQFSLVFLSYLIVLVALRDFCGFIGWTLGQEWITYSFKEAIILLMTSLGFVILGNLFLHRGPHLVDLHIHSEKVSSAFDGFQILQISDLHLGTNMSQKFLDRALAKIKDLRPDLIVLTGDIFDGTIDQMGTQLSFFSQLQYKEQILFVSGNHEYYWDWSLVKTSIDLLPIRPLENETLEIKRGAESLLIHGIPDRTAGYFKFQAPDLNRLNWNPEVFQILLSHQPRVFKESQLKKVDLQLSGHTHGGQWWPWNWMLWIFEPYQRGLYIVDESHLYVSQGTGYWGPPHRLGTRSEITLITLKSKN